MKKTRKSKKEGQAPIVVLVNQVISNAIKRGASVVRFQKTDPGLLILETSRDSKAMEQKSIVPLRLESGIRARLKIMADLSIMARGIVQVGTYEFRTVPYSPDERRGDGATRKIRIISLPNLNSEEMVIDLVPQPA